MKTFGRRTALMVSIVLSCTITLANEWNEFNLEKLKSTVKEKNIKTIDQLMGAIPQDMKKNPLLVYESKALKTDLVSFETPRILLFNRDASLILSISKHPGDAAIKLGKDSLEIIAFNSQTGKFEMFDEVFDGVRSPFTGKMKANPKNCTVCHGAEPRPIFHDYNGWPGIYGSFGTTGVAVLNSVEHAGLQKFLGSQPQLKRYQDLDLSGFYAMPAGIAYKSQGFSELHDKAKFTVSMSFGVEVESLMHRRLASKLKKRKDFADIFPLFYYLGDEADTFGKVESRCGHPNLRTQKAYETLTSLYSGQAQALEEIIKKIGTQVEVDYAKRKDAVEKNNILAPEVDPRGIAPVPYANYVAVAINKSPDPESFKKQTALIEVVFQALKLNTTDISTSKDTLTTGIYHLSRLGRLAVDEQYFQNLIRGFKWASPELVAEYAKMSCEDVEAKGLEALKNLVKEPIQVKTKGVLYK